MTDLNLQVNPYLEFCRNRKALNEKTLKAYRIDLKQFLDFTAQDNADINRDILANFIAHLHKTYQPRTTKRKIASVKAFFTFLYYEGFIAENPFSKLITKFHEPKLLPRIISLESMQKIFHCMYVGQIRSDSVHQQKAATRNTAVVELLFATGIRVSELCGLLQENVDLGKGAIRICGKGSKERIIQVANQSVLHALTAYKTLYAERLQGQRFFFLNRRGNHLSEQSVRYILTNYAKQAHIPEHITPHMFRHTFATMLLEENVDIRYIQQILGHSSITTTQIYTHVTSTKQREILTEKHPRNHIQVLGNE